MPLTVFEIIGGEDRMTRDAIRLVQCLLSKKKGNKSKSEIRFVPYQEFEFWKYYISNHYGFSVSNEEIFIWLPEKEFTKRKERLAHIPSIPVHKVTLYFFLKKDGILVPLTRFFREADYKKVRPVFLKHFEEFDNENHLTKVLEHINEEKGVCLRSA
jgi:hypothetical protein